MPNWCENRLYVFGDDEVVAAFEQKFETEQTLEECCANYRQLSSEHEDALEVIANATVLELGGKGEEWRGDGPLNRIVPMPPVLHSVMSSHPPDPMSATIEKLIGYSSGYDWAVENWGTKWDTEVHAGNPWFFQTAWAPPVSWLVTASQNHPGLTLVLYYTEMGMDFCGWSVARSGLLREWMPKFSAVAEACRGRSCPDWEEDEDGADEWHEGIENVVLDAMELDLDDAWKPMGSNPTEEEFLAWTEEETS